MFTQIQGDGHSQLPPAPAVMVTKYYSSTSQAGHSHYSTTWQIALQTSGQSNEIGRFKYEATDVYSNYL